MFKGISYRKIAERTFNLVGRIGLVVTMLIVVALNYPPLLTKLSEAHMEFNSVILLLATIWGLVWLATWEPKK